MRARSGSGDHGGAGALRHWGFSLLQDVERGADLRVARLLLEVVLDFRPGHFAGLVDDVDGRMGDAFDLHPFIGGVSQAVGVDGLAAGIGEEREGDLAFAVRGDLLGEAAAVFRLVDAEGVDVEGLAVLAEAAEFGQLPSAERSPVAAVEDEDHGALPARGRERDLLIARVLEGEVGGHVAHRDRLGAGRLGGGRDGRQREGEGRGQEEVSHAVSFRAHGHLNVRKNKSKIFSRRSNLCVALNAVLPLSTHRPDRTDRCADYGAVKWVGF